MNERQFEDGRLRTLALESETSMKRLCVPLFAILLMGSVPGHGQTQQATPNSKESTPTPTAPSAATVDKGAANPNANIDQSTYVIGPEDVLQITVWKEPTISGAVPVRPDGNISLVLAGDMPAAGRTPMQLAAEITSRLKKYVQDPNVSVVVTGVNSHRIYLVGEVGHVGPIPLTAGMSPLQAIAAAGGLGPFANSKRIYILRGEQGKQQKIPFDYKGAMKGDSKQNIVLLPGDTIVVP
jgi:polysaccharide export outer membrane protein